jgi:hypothetical protein
VRFQINKYLTLDLAFKVEPKVPAVVESFEYVENIQSGLPTCKLVLHVRDNTSEFISKAVYDGASIVAKITHSKIDSPIVLPLSIFGNAKLEPNKTLGEGYTLPIVATLDFKKYLTGVTQNAYKGTVSTVLATLARECKLKTNILQTGGNQVWFSYGKTYKNLAQYLTDHSYISSTSLPVLGVTAPGVLIFKDVTFELKKSTKHTLKYLTSADPSLEENLRVERAVKNNEYVFTTYESSNLSGILNSSGAYGNLFIQDSVNSSKQFENNLIDFSRSLKNSEINNSVKGVVKNTDTHYLPLDVGNTYPEFTKAYAKNIRLRTVYSNVLKVMLIEDFSKIKLLDTVTVQLDEKYENGKDPLFAGKYIVVHKTVSIVKNLYREVLTLINYGRNMNSIELV